LIYFDLPHYFPTEAIKYTQRAQSFSRAINAKHVATGTHFISVQFINKPAKKSFEFPANATATPIAVSGVNKKKPPKRQKYF